MQKNKEDQTINVNKSKREGYAQLWAGWIKNTKLSWAAKAILAYLCNKPEGWVCRVRDLCNHTWQGEDAIRGMLDELRAAGYAVLEVVRAADGTVWGTRFLVDEDPIYAGRKENAKFAARFAHRHLRHEERMKRWAENASAKRNGKTKPRLGKSQTGLAPRSVKPDLTKKESVPTLAAGAASVLFSDSVAGASESEKSKNTTNNTPRPTGDGVAGGIFPFLDETEPDGACGSPPSAAEAKPFDDPQLEKKFQQLLKSYPQHMRDVTRSKALITDAGIQKARQFFQDNDWTPVEVLYVCRAGAICCRNFKRPSRKEYHDTYFYCRKYADKFDRLFDGPNAKGETNFQTIASEVDYAAGDKDDLELIRLLNQAVAAAPDSGEEAPDRTEQPA